MYRNHPVTDYLSVIDPDSQFIDVRQPEEVATGAIDGAINIPLGELPTRMQELRRSAPFWCVEAVGAVAKPRSSSAVRASATL